MAEGRENLNQKTEENRGEEGMRRFALQMFGVAAACICIGCSGGVLDLADVDAGSGGEVSFGDADLGRGEELPLETTAPECTTNLDCEGKFVDLDVCEIALCDSVSQVCVKGSLKDYSACDDGDVCTQETYCLAGVCGSGIDVVCNDGNVCTADSCDPVSGCQFTNVTLPCDDGNPCTLSDTCADGMCVGQPGGCPCESDLDCDADMSDLCDYDIMVCQDGFCTVTESIFVSCDGSMDATCQINQCNPATGGCEMVPVAGVCSDDQTCTVGDYCQEGVCVPGNNMCDCAVDADCAEFDSGNLCTGSLACLEGKCAIDPASAVTCSQVGLGQCEVSSCTPDTGACEISAKANGAACDDGDVCTDVDVCTNGQCVGTATDCDDGNPCTQDTCDAAGGCINTPFVDVPCDDGDVCTGGDMCVDGVCLGGENVCGDCGDATCDANESCQTCPDDCGICGDCCAIQEGPGCADEAIQACTCALDAFCCESVWDDICIEEAVAECGLLCGGGCGDALCDDSEDCQSCPADCGECADCGDAICQGAEDCQTCPDDCGPCPVLCCDALDVPGCEDPAIEACVCELDAYCCETAWDDICVGEVEEFGCGICGLVEECGNGVCDETEACYSCPQDCGTCDTCGDAVCGQLESCKLCPEDCGACAFCGDDTCDDNEDCKSCPADCGECCGNDACEALLGETCESCPADCGDCPDACGDQVCGEGESCTNCAVDCGPCEGSCCLPSDAPGCANLEVQSCVCAADAFCCEVMWDEICAAEADECGSCNGDCCGSHASPGCQDEEIEICVCAADAFCCDVAWDGLCVAEVTDLQCGVCDVVAECGDNMCDDNEDCKSCPADCGECCGNDACEALLGETCETCPADCGACPEACGDNVCGDDENCVNCAADCGDCTGSCCLANGTEGCIDDNVQGCVCAMDPFCCNVQWDGLCAQEADECDACNGACCAVNGNEGCDDEPIETCVCAEDPYCCNVNWDQLCVNEVESLNCGSCAVADVCGDGICGDTETCETCANDCGACMGGCCEAHDGTGCADGDCVAFICEIDAYCCETEWDQICADEALQYCPVCQGTFPTCGDGECLFGETCETCAEDCGPCEFCGDNICNGDEDCASCPDDCGACDSDCCVASGGQGCDDAACTDFVCAEDPYCCSNNWDNICAQEAGAWCPVCGGDFPVCGDGQCGSGESCDNCPEDCGVCPPECGDQECNGDETCASCPADCGVCPPECGDQECNGDETCASCPGDCGACNSNCCAATGTPECDNAQCVNVVCAVDPFCCSNNWDGICGTEALEMCPVCGGALPGGNCCVEQNQTTGCEDGACQDIVCAVDAFCCETEWDMLCADEALEMCASCGGQVLPAVCGDNECNGEETCDSCAGDCGDCCGNGVCEAAFGEDCNTCTDDCGECPSDCCAPNGTPECDDTQCVNVVCAADPFCCSNNWDGICGTEALEMCPVCGGALPGGNCCVEQDQTTGCEDGDCQNIVCAVDAFCCETEWDMLCADEALEMCASCGGVTQAFCGDNECNGDEDCASCTEDCGDCCGDGVCDGNVGEDCASCAADCGACPVASCQDRCGDAYDQGQVCQCDDICFGAGDCCQDVCYHCDASTFPEECGAITDTCEFRCGEYDQAKACQCDAVCFVENDCCDDVCTNCGDEYPQQCP
jgi:hypothetical protein